MFKATCEFNKKDLKVRVLNYFRIQPDEDVLKKALASVGPIAIGFSGNRNSFMSYKSGIYEDSECESSIDKINSAGRFC